MQKRLKLWNFFNRRKRIPLIVVGTHFDSFQLCEALHEDGGCQVKFVINEEPWQHKTIFADAQCRYPSELGALVKNYSVRGVVFFSGVEHECAPTMQREKLAVLGCELIEVQEGGSMHDMVQGIKSIFET